MSEFRIELQRLGITPAIVPNGELQRLPARGFKAGPLPDKRPPVRP